MNSITRALFAAGSLTLSILLNSAHAQNADFSKPQLDQSANAARAGCLHKPLSVCLDSFGSLLSDGKRMSLKESMDDDDKKVDVNGHHIGSRDLNVTPTINGKAIFITLTRGPHDEVARATAMLDGLENAETLDDYDSTGVFQVLQIVLGSDCIQDRATIYKFLHNTLMRRLSKTSRTTELGDTSASVDYRSRVRNVKLCDAKIDFEVSSGVDTSFISETNSEGIYNYDQFTFH